MSDRHLEYLKIHYGNWGFIFQYVVILYVHTQISLVRYSSNESDPGYNSDDFFLWQYSSPYFSYIFLFISLKRSIVHFYILLQETSTVMGHVNSPRIFNDYIGTRVVYVCELIAADEAKPSFVMMKCANVLKFSPQILTACITGCFHYSRYMNWYTKLIRSRTARFHSEYLLYYNKKYHWNTVWRHRLSNTYHTTKTWSRAIQWIRISSGWI